MNYLLGIQFCFAVKIFVAGKRTLFDQKGCFHVDFLKVYTATPKHSLTSVFIDFLKKNYLGFGLDFTYRYHLVKGSLHL